MCILQQKKIGEEERNRAKQSYMLFLTVDFLQ